MPYRVKGIPEVNKTGENLTPRSCFDTSINQSFKSKCTIRLKFVNLLENLFDFYELEYEYLNV